MFNNKLIEYLKGPELVVQIQEFFGIKYHHNNNKESGKIQIKNKKDSYNSNNNNNNNNKDYNNNNSNNLKNTSKIIIKKNDPSNDGDFHSRSNKTRTSPTILDNEKSDETATDSENIISTKTSSSSSVYYEITNKFWYYLFIIGTEFGDELFYATMIPFWFWNIDGAVGRRVVFVWSIVMYIGQGLKDVIRWPRPGLPVQRLQNKWGLEYGMPSTHAMVSIAMPFSVVLFMIDRYQFSIITGFIISIMWSSIICISRVYLGMHSVLDIIVGLLLTIVLMIPLIPLVNYLDFIILSFKYAPLFILAISILMIIYYPRSDKWTPTRGDTTMTLSVTAGIQIGSWLNYQLDNMTMFSVQSPSPSPSPYEILWPTYPMIGLLILRTILGLCCVIGTRAIGKSIGYGIVCTAIGRNKREMQNAASTLENTEKIFVELTNKYITCLMIGFNTIYLLPNVFKMLNIGRPDFYTEI